MASVPGNLNPLDFYLWGHPETCVHAAPVNEETLRHRTVDACQTIDNYLGISEWTRCAESSGRHFEHLL
jgi:hypothetical protein